MDNLLPCPICGDKLKIHGPEDWKPTRYDPDSGGDPYSASCDCGFHYSNGSYDYSEFILCLNRRAQPSEKPLTLDELRQMDGEPVWVERLWGAKIKKWIIASPNEYGLTQGVHEKSQFMAWKTYGVLWRALRSKPKEEV